ncbi:uridine kinase [Bacillus sp. RO3]|nr:uridine kinase [Bacillus sp. RO3]
MGIDGLGGSGKTTLSKQMCHKLKAANFESFILHIDDYIVHKENRYQTGWEEWYEYYFLQWDLERLQKELFEKIHHNVRLLTLPYYDHLANTLLDEKVNVPPNAIVIIEGVFLQRKEWRRYFDFMIYLSCSHKLRSKRVLNRDTYLGDYGARLEKYEKRYWSAENYYLQNEDPMGKADYIYEDIDSIDHNKR